MRVLVLHAAIPPEAPPDEQDVLREVATVVRGLTEAGHEAIVAPTAALAGDLPALLAEHRPEVVFNLIETLDGDARIGHVVPALLAHAGVPFTGNSAAACFATTHKILAKRLLRAEGVPTPAWWEPAVGETPDFDGPFLVKPLWEDASVGIDDDALCADEFALAGRLGAFGGARHVESFVEAFVAGREFNVALLEQHGAPRALPPAEIRFDGFPEGKPQLVGYAAKWDEDSFEYHHTPRSFDFPPEDAELTAELVALAKRCWALFGLRGYARVDFRVGRDGVPQVLEVNANPCISDDAGFVAAAERAGLSLGAVMDLIVDAALPTVAVPRSARG